MNYTIFSGKLFVLLFLFVLVLGLIIYLSLALVKKDKKPSHSPMDNPNIVNRFQKLRLLWYQVAADTKFKQLTDALGDTNSESLYNNIGSVNILNAFNALDQYVKNNMNLDKDMRITLIYTDGIVFYDSALTIDRVYFLQNGLPRPVSMSTLGSPLKNHNVVPEITNAVSVHSKTGDLSLLGYSLTDPIYPQLLKEGFGFFDRISSSLNVPYSYIARFLPSPKQNGFIDGYILRISLPV